MEQTLFDSARPPDDAPPASRRRDDSPLTVGQVSQLVRRALADRLPATVRVVGEVSNFSGRQHWFFSLKDEQSTLSCVCFASNARRVGFPMANGLAVVVTGRIDYYDAQGRLQLYADAIEPVGQGALELQFRLLCERLRGEGYFDAKHKKPLPATPRCVAVVTSRAAAALQDVINTATKRWAGCRLLLFDVPVQGAEAAPQIARAIAAISQGGARIGIEAVLLTRGGGSMEDLWAFNDPAVAEAIFACRLPIVAAIGHETDTTIAELVADLRCATPTAAVMELVPHRDTLEQQIQQLSRRLALGLKRLSELCGQRLCAVEYHPFIRRPLTLVDRLKERLDRLNDRLAAGLPNRVAAAIRQVEALAKHLESVGPTNVLRRGYSYTLTDDGGVVRSAKQVAPGRRIVTVLGEGRLTSVVEPDSPHENRSP